MSERVASPDPAPAFASFPSTTPLFQVIVDTEEEFDWSKPFSRQSTSVQAMDAQWRAQEVFDRYGVTPTYVVDHPVAANPDAAAILAAFHSAGRCYIGAHLHPWVNPPFEEVVLASNSYPGNLNPRLERKKLHVLTTAIEDAFGVRPRVYKAGRYGLGPHSSETLAALGYLVDVSVVPNRDFSADGGPDFRGYPLQPYWLDQRGGVLEIPLSHGFAGPRRRRGGRWFQPIEHVAETRLPARLLAWLRLMERISLTPEGHGAAAQRRLVRSLLRDGCPVLTLTYHSPSLVPGNTPYVRNPAQLERMLGSIRRMLDFILGTICARPTHALEIHALALQNPSSPSG